MPTGNYALQQQQKLLVRPHSLQCLIRACRASTNLPLLLLLLVLLLVAACRACIKAHKLALLSQRAFWRCVMRDSLSLADMLDALKAMQQAEQTATYVYKRCDWRLEFDLIPVFALLYCCCRKTSSCCKGWESGVNSSPHSCDKMWLLLHTAAVAACFSTAPLIRHNL
jgi:hypothetical protein